MTDRSPGWRLLMGDMAFNLIAMLTLVIAILLVFFNPPTEAEDTRAPGDLRFWCEWPSELDADIDMWVKPPKGRPVGYSNKTTAYADLLRDDLGFFRDISNNNEELVSSRGLLPGEWQLNLHYFAYRAAGAVKPIPVKCWAEISNDGRRKVLVEADKTLRTQGDEVTMFRFTISEDRVVDPASVNDRFQPLRSSTYTPFGAPS